VSTFTLWLMTGAAGSGLTVTVTVDVVEQLPLAPVTVEVVVDVGLALTTDPVVALRPVAGLQV